MNDSTSQKATSSDNLSNPWAPRRSSLRALLARARTWQTALDFGNIPSAADIARSEGLSPARISQLLSLLQLAPSILANLEDPSNDGPVPPEHALRSLVQIRLPDTQLARFRDLLQRETAPSRGGRQCRPETLLPRRGFQHLFEQARDLQRQWSSGQFRSLNQLGDTLGVSGERVAQLIRLLHLAPDLLEQLDVPEERLPPGLSAHDLVQLARIQSHAEQRRQFDVMVIERARVGGDRRAAGVRGMTVGASFESGAQHAGYPPGVSR